MRWALTRGFVLAFAGLFMGAVACVSVYSFDPTMRFTMDRDPASVVAGLYPVETDPSGLSFAWSRERLEVDLPGLNRRGDWRVAITARGARPGSLPQPTLVAAVDGVQVATFAATNTFQTWDVPIGARDDVQAGARVVITATPSFSPGAGDPRQLGVQVDDIFIEPESGFGVLPPRAVLVDGALAAAAAAAAFGLIRVTAGSTIAGAGVIAVGQALVLTNGVAPFSHLAGRALTLMILLAATLVGAVWLLEWVLGDSLRNTARFVGIFAIAATYLKLLVLWHPGIDVRDALFQAHRFEWVLSGRYFFTSIAPGNYEFPYAIALYVLAAPLRALASNTAGLMDVLRAVVALTDAFAAILLYPLLLRAGASRLAGAVAVATYHLMPLDFAIQWVANQTNAFGQSMFTIAVAALVFSQGRMTGGSWVARMWVITGVALAFAVTFLAHTSSFAIGGAFIFVLTALVVTVGRGTLRSLATPLLIVAVVATGFAWWCYYGHFWDVYLAQYGRITGEVAQPAEASDPGGRSMLDRAALVPRYVTLYFGVPAAVLAAWGAVVTWRDRRRDLETLTLWAWVLTCLAFLVLGILTPVDMRYYLAALPAMAWLAARGTEWMWTNGTIARGGATILLLWVSWNGIEQWLEPLGR